uniref:L1 transposable element RRM domain-containing protein n=1 Tax=Equus caballus TaxID=9796 RepID=A0A9L0SV47_HORSE
MLAQGQSCSPKKEKEMKNTVMEMKNSLEGLSSRVKDTEEWISELGERLEEITQAQHIKEKRIKKNENSLKELWDNIKYTNIHIIGVPEGNERDKENLFEEIAENFPNLRKETDIQIQEAQRAPNEINPKRPIPRHIKERILKARRERQQVTCKGNLSLEYSTWQGYHTKWKKKEFSRQAKN